MVGKTVCRAQRKSALTALVGESQRLLEAPFSFRWIIDLRVSGEASLDPQAFDLVPVVATSTRDVARLRETVSRLGRLVGADIRLGQPAQIGGQPVEEVRRVQEIALLLQRVDSFSQATGTRPRTNRDTSGLPKSKAAAPLDCARKRPLRQGFDRLYVPLQRVKRADMGKGVAESVGVPQSPCQFQCVSPVHDRFAGFEKL